jgi:hypothetical protein
MSMTRNYLLEAELAMLRSKESYAVMVLALQNDCPHKTVLKHEDTTYECFYVCEDCGITARAEYGSPSRAYGEAKLLGRRCYKVSWTDFVRATPGDGIGWVQRQHNGMSAAQAHLDKIRTQIDTVNLELIDGYR